MSCRKALPTTDRLVWVLCTQDFDMDTDFSADGKHLVLHRALAADNLRRCLARVISSIGTGQARSAISGSVAVRHVRRRAGWRVSNHAPATLVKTSLSPSANTHLKQTSRLIHNRRKPEAETCLQKNNLSATNPCGLSRSPRANKTPCRHSSDMLCLVS